MNRDPLYFPRHALAEVIINSLKSGITHAFTLFAPRRMGKTQFLLNDVAPMAEQSGFNVFYFSFMDDAAQNIPLHFQKALYQFSQQINKASGVKTFLGGISKIDIMGVGIEKHAPESEMPPLSTVLNTIANDNRPTLLLLDEVQELARIKGTDGIIRALRTGLDINQGAIKTIFTGSSTNGLRAMFNDNKAPFFHFAHAMDFPRLGKDFTDFLATVYHDRTGHNINTDALYEAFERMNHTPLFMRATIQDMIINPELSIEQAAHARIGQMQENSEFPQQWHGLSSIEQIIMVLVANGTEALYSTQSREHIAARLGVDDVTTSAVQNAVRKLERKDLITRDSANRIQINNPIFKTWILERIEL